MCLEEQMGTLQPTTWINQLSQIISHLGFSIQYLLSVGHQAKAIFKQRVLDVNAQTDIEAFAKSRSPKWLAKNKMSFQTEKHLRIGLTQYHRIAILTRARFEQLDSMVKYGRFHQVPYFERTCVCGASEIEDIVHVLFNCKLYTAARSQYLQSLLDKIIHWDCNKQLSYFLQGTNIYVVSRTVKFIVRYIYYSPGENTFYRIYRGGMQRR